MVSDKMFCLRSKHIHSEERNVTKIDKIRVYQLECLDNTHRNSERNPILYSFVSVRSILTFEQKRIGLGDGATDWVEVIFSTQNVVWQCLRACVCVCVFSLVALKSVK